MARECRERGLAVVVAEELERLSGLARRLGFFVGAAGVGEGG